MNFIKVTILIVFIGAFVQSASSQSKKFLQGSWKTTANDQITRISAANIDQVKIFKISTTPLDALDVKFNVYLDGLVVSSVLHEGGSAYVEGKSVSIKQITSGAVQTGIWEVVDDEEFYLDQLSWVCPPGEEKVLVSSFSSATSFVLSTNATSTGCSNGKIAVFVDGVQMKEDINNSNLLLLEGASYHGKGKRIEVSATGNCRGDSAFYGTLKFIK